MSQLLVSWLVIGAIAGGLVYLFSSRRAPGGLIGNLLSGIVGAVVGGYLVTVGTHADVMRASLTWGILVVSFVSGLIVGIIVQSQSSLRTEKTAKPAHAKK
jgi:uncharacterized membrane protein YeaQ/YmgE (transglycosylase-associated protein family)